MKIPTPRSGSLDPWLNECALCDWVISLNESLSLSSCSHSFFSSRGWVQNKRASWTCDSAKLSELPGFARTTGSARSRGRITDHFKLWEVSWRVTQNVGLLLLYWSVSFGGKSYGSVALCNTTYKFSFFSVLFLNIFSFICVSCPADCSSRPATN